jgi:hypothetical protein
VAPQPLRGRLWQVFLCLEGKREAGLYDQLVQKALGNTKYGRKVRLCNSLSCVVAILQYLHLLPAAV